MGVSESPFRPLPQSDLPSDLQTLMGRPRAGGDTNRPTGGNSMATTARLHDFDLQGAPVLAGLANFPGELVRARTFVALRRSMVGATVLILHEDGDWTRPIVAGVLQEPNLESLSAPARPAIDVQADGECLSITAEREIVLRCGDASITLTRSGKVLIQGRYVLSRSSGYNKIKGAAVDIN